MKNDIWDLLIEESLNKTSTPFYLFSTSAIEDQLNKIHQICDFPVYSCLSIKTLPLKELLKWWKTKELFAEVTSEYELIAALTEGFTPHNIVVNGVAKHSWSENVWTDGLRVNFDSCTEIRELSDMALKKKWHVGIRFHPRVQNDPETPSFPDQFGISSNDFKIAVEWLILKGIKLENVHIHLRSNIPNFETFISAVDELYENLKLLNLNIKSIDIGGGLPSANIKQKDLSWSSVFNLRDVSCLVNYIKNKFTDIVEIFFEYGRFVLSSCGIIVFTVIDIKNMNGVNFIICDGGRVNNALPSDWEVHKIEVYPKRVGKLIEFNLCGSTCMAYDCFSRTNLPENIQIGDKIIYFDAGAYHLSWESHFSHPLSNILWHNHEENSLSLVRKKESFEEWWSNSGL